MAHRQAHLLIAAALLSLLEVGSLRAVQIEGTIRDMTSNDVLPRATIQVVGSGRSTLANEEGFFRILLGPGERELKFSHIGYYSKWLTVEPADTLEPLEIYLPPAVIELKDVVVTSRAYDAAQSIIIEAIKRKQDILQRLHNCSFEAYTKMVVRDESAGEDSGKIMIITETQSTSYWEYPDRYKEVLTARKQSANMSADENLVSVHDVLNFNKNRLDLDRWQVVTPTAEDALDHYDYYLIDSTYIDSIKVYALEIVPRNQIDPLLTGSIQIVDSTFDVVGVDVGFNEAVDIPHVEDLRYRQCFALFEREYWMPVEIGVSAYLCYKFPGVPSKMSVDYISSLHSYNFEEGHPEGTFDEYSFEVLEDADDFDSSNWASRQTIPLTNTEIRGYQILDSLENVPKPLYKHLLNGMLGVVMLLSVGDYDFFHFQRVDGPYLGFRFADNGIIPRTRFWVQPGYGFDSELWQLGSGLEVQLERKRALSVGAAYRKRLMSRELVGKRWYNPTFEALFFKHDPFDYYYEEGFFLFASSKLLRNTSLSMTYSDFDQSTTQVETDYSFFGGDREFRPNPVISDGHLRAVAAEFRYDSRALWRLKGRDAKLMATQYTVFKVGAEVSSPDVLRSDFDYRKLYASLYRRQRVFGLGVATLDLYAGSATRSLPPQRYFSVGFDDPFVVTKRGFFTLNDSLYHGNRILLIHLCHDFEKQLFRRSGLPLVKEIPFTLAMHGGVFWTDFVNHDRQPGDALLSFASKPYAELGFSVGNLTPFIWPLNLELYFTWQLSDYETKEFTWLIGFDF